MKIHFILTLQWRYNERDGISNDRRLDSLLNCLLRRRLKKTSKLRITGLCEENPPVTSVFPSQRASNADNVSIWWRHRENFGIFPGSVQKMSLLINHTMFLLAGYRLFLIYPDTEALGEVQNRWTEKEHWGQNDPESSRGMYACISLKRTKTYN